MRLRILIADDEPIEHRVLSKIIRQSNLPADIIDVARTGNEVLELYERYLPDLIFMDIRMPGISGLDASTMIKEKQPETVIAISTAYDEFHYAKRAIDLHIDYFMLKPVEPNEVERIIQNTIIAKSASIHDANPTTLSPARTQLAQEIIQYLHRNYAHPVTLADLEALFNFSPQYLNRTFKEAYHDSIINYLTKFRIQLALKLLTDPELSIATIAEKVGIPDVSYFGQMFKQHQGTTPSQYRNRSYTQLQKPK